MWLLQRHSLHKSIIIFFMVLLGIVTVLICQGCNSLTGRMWAHDPMRLENKLYSNVTCYVNSDNPREYYFELFTNYGVKSFRLTNISKSSYGDVIVKSSDELLLSDYTQVNPKNRKLVTYYFIIIRHEISRPFSDYEGGFLFSMFNTKIEPVASKPVNFTNELTIKTVRLRKYSPVELGYFDYFIKGIATPLTLVSDIIIIPVCYSLRYLDFAMHFPH